MVDENVSRRARLWLRTAASICIALFWATCVYSADPRANFLKVVDRPRVPLDAKVESVESKDAALQESHFTFAAEANQRVPGILIKQKSEAGTVVSRRPVVIALHGTGNTKENERSLVVQLAKRGFVAVAIDGRYHGERTQAGKGSREYEQAILRAWQENGSADKRGEHPFFIDTVWDVMRLVDYLETRDDVDAKRIGLIGTSKGGIETYLTAAVDPRIAVAVPCIGLQSFGWAVDNNAWKSRVGTVQTAFNAAATEAGAEKNAEFVREFYRRVAPGIDGQFDGPAMAPLIAPRPLMVINGDKDDRTPLPGLKLCTDAAQAAYHAANADDHFLVRIQENTGHAVTGESRRAAIDWFAKWLQP